VDDLWTSQFAKSELKNHILSNYVIPIFHQTLSQVDQSKAGKQSKALTKRVKAEASIPG